MQTIVRGSTVRFSSTFKDEGGITFTPSGAQVKIKYRVAGVLTGDTLALSNNSGLWQATWASSVSDPDQVDWFVTTTSSIKSVDEGSFLLVANEANGS